MATLDLDTFIGVLFNNTNLQAVYYNNSLIWPKSHSYSLKNVVVNYSNSSSISPSCNDYAWLTATLVDSYLGQSTETTVTLSPSIKTANDLYVITGNNITANTSKKKTEYSQQTTQFTGTYTINGQTLSVTAGVTASSVLLTANVKTTTPASQQTTKYEIYVSETDILGTGGTSTVSGTRTYNSTSVRYDWTSGEHEGGDTSTGLKEYNKAATSCRVNPTTGATCSGNTITFAANNNTSARSYNVYGTYDGVESTNECTITQYANSYAYSTVNVSIAYELIDASGGTVYPTVSYSQTYGWAPSTTGVGTVTSGGTITYYVEEEVSSNGAVSANSLGTSRRTTNTKIAEECYAVVSLNGKGGESSHVSVYQTTNDIESTSAVVTITIGGVAKTEYTCGPQDAEYSFDATSYRTYIWTSNASSNEIKQKSSLTITKSGTWVTLTTAGFKTSENTSNYSRSGSITVKDSTYGQAQLSLTQEKVSYEFYAYAPQSNAFSIGYNDTSFTISVQSMRNGKPYSISTSNITFSSNGFSGLSKSGVAQSPLDDTVYVATFTCNANSVSSVRSVTITFKQPTSNQTVVYNVEQAAYVAATITTSTDYLVINTVGGSYANFTITTNKNWSIDTDFAMCDFNGDSLGSDMAACSVNISSGTAGTTTVHVTRGSYTANSIIDIKITSENTIAHVIVVPQFTLSNLITSWSPDYNSNTVRAISTNYPSISWSGTNLWLTASGEYISVSPYNGSSNRTGTVQASGSFSGTFFGVQYSTSASSSNISVTQAAAPQVTYIYVIGDKRYKEVYLSTSNNSVPSSITVPKAVYISGVSVYGTHGLQPHTGGYAVIASGQSWQPVSFDDQPLDDDEEIDIVLQPGTVQWGGNGQAPEGYALGSASVIWV